MKRRDEKKGNQRDLERKKKERRERRERRKETISKIYIKNVRRKK